MASLPSVFLTHLDETKNGIGFQFDAFDGVKIRSTVTTYGKEGSSYKVKVLMECQNDRKLEISVTGSITGTNSKRRSPISDVFSAATDQAGTSHESSEMHGTIITTGAIVLTLQAVVGRVVDGLAVEWEAAERLVFERQKKLGQRTSREPREMTSRVTKIESTAEVGLLVIGSSKMPDLKGLDMNAVEKKAEEELFFMGKIKEEMKVSLQMGVRRGWRVGVSNSRKTVRSRVKTLIKGLLKDHPLKVLVVALHGHANVEGLFLYDGKLITRRDIERYVREACLENNAGKKDQVSATIIKIPMIILHLGCMNYPESPKKQRDWKEPIVTWAVGYGEEVKLVSEAETLTLFPTKIGVGVGNDYTFQTVQAFSDTLSETDLVTVSVQEITRRVKSLSTPNTSRKNFSTAFEIDNLLAPLFLLNGITKQTPASVLFVDRDTENFFVARKELEMMFGSAATKD